MCLNIRIYIHVQDTEINEVDMVLVMPLRHKKAYCREETLTKLNSVSPGVEQVGCSSRRSTASASLVRVVAIVDACLYDGDILETSATPNVEQAESRAVAAVKMSLVSDVEAPERTRLSRIADMFVDGKGSGGRSMCTEEGSDAMFR